MPFGVTPAADQPVFPAAQADVQVINLLVSDVSRLIVMRGVGENSHVATIRLGPATVQPATPWNSANEVVEGDWDFSEADFVASVNYIIA